MTKRTAIFISAGLVWGLSACSVKEDSEAWVKADASGLSQTEDSVESALSEAQETEAQDVLPEVGEDALDLSLASKVLTDLPYGDTSERQKLDVYLPHGEAPYPTIFAIHGGGFMFGSKSGGGNTVIIESGLARGYAVIAVGYRLSGEAPFPVAVNDVQAAIVYAREQAQVMGLDDTRFVSWGGSAGGNLAAMVATKGSAEENNHVQAAIDWFGPIMFDAVDAQFEALGIEPKLGATSSADSPESKYLGQTVGTLAAAELVIAASPQSYITPDDPAIYIQHGSEDANVPLTQSQNFQDALREVLGEEKVVFEVLDGAGHGGAEFEAPANLDKIYAFLEAQLK